VVELRRELSRLQSMMSVHRDCPVSRQQQQQQQQRVDEEDAVVAGEDAEDSGGGGVVLLGCVGDEEVIAMAALSSMAATATASQSHCDHSGSDQFAPADQQISEQIHAVSSEDLKQPTAMDLSSAHCVIETPEPARL